MTPASRTVLRRLAARYVWWKPPAQALRNPERIAAQVMNIGDYDDVQILVKAAGKRFLRGVLHGAEIGTPMPVVERLHAAITAAINSKAYKDRMAQAEGEIPSMTIAETRKFVDDDTVMWGNLIRSLNLKLDQ